MIVEITSTLEQFSTNLTSIARDLGGDLGRDLGGELGVDLAVIILSWSQGNWGLGIKAGISTGTSSPMAQTKVALSEGLLCPASLGT